MSTQHLEVLTTSPSPRVMILGSEGQLGSELTAALSTRYGAAQVLATDLVQKHKGDHGFEILNATDAEAVDAAIARFKPDHVYHLVAVLSATGEKDPERSWAINMDSLLGVLSACRKHGVGRVYWPSSIAAFGPRTPQNPAPQLPYMDPTTVYGISKLAGELWAQYACDKWGMDVRSLRYPGLISYKTPPGGGTTDYAVDIFYHAAENKPYSCFLAENTRLPMMYMDDAVRATIELMEADPERIKERTSYNLNAIDFTPAELAAAIQSRVSGFEVTYAPDARQAIAESWPQTIDDSAARSDWGWKHEFGLDELVDAMLAGLKK